MSLKTKIKNQIKRMLTKQGIHIQRWPEGKPNPIHLWEEHPEFNSLVKESEGRTLVDKTRCFILYQFANQVSDLSGDIAEIGVYRGGTAKLLTSVFGPYGKDVHLFDTFAGMPSTDAEKDYHREGDFSDTSLESVMKYVGEKGVHYHQGFFPATADSIKDKVFSLVHVDVDIYQSVLDCCEFFYPRMTSGGVLIFDDYGFISCPGAKLAVDEFFEDKPEYACYLPSGQAVVTKL